MTCQEEMMLDALKTRLETITEANGYPITVKKVLLSQGQITFNTPEMECPQIEIIQLSENYTHHATGFIEVSSGFALRLVGPKRWTDKDMARFKSAVIRAIYANSYTQKANAGITLDASIVFPRLQSCETDYNLVPGNRIYALSFELKSNRTTHSF